MLRSQVYQLVQGRRRDRGAGSLLDAFLLTLIVVSVLSTLLETSGALMARFAVEFRLVELIAGAAFVAEYLARAWTCVEDPRGRYSGPGGRLRYLATPLALIDLLAIVPTIFALLGLFSAELLWFLRTLRVLKLLRYSAAVEVFAVVLRHERRQLISALTIMMVLLVFLSSVVYLAEREVQPDKFGTVTDAMWWGIVTLATVGYGDVVPITPVGRLIGGFAVVLGMGMFALPAGILASGFVEEMRRRNFVVTWNLVANVPFFSNLPATRIADIAAVLQPEHARRGEVIVRRGDPADCMYFLVSGEVLVDLAPRPVRLEPGDFFGEIALLTDQPRTATVVAASECQLLILRLRNFRAILAANADLREVISRTAQERLVASGSAAGDDANPTASSRIG